MTHPWLGHYDAHVPSHLDYPPIGLGALLRDTAAAHPDWVALSINDTDVSYGELDARANRFAHALRGLGVSKGDRVALVLPNSPAYVTACYGALKLGAVLVNVNVTTAGPPLTRILRHTGAKVVVTFGPFLPAVAGALRGTDVEQLIVQPMPGPGPELDLGRIEPKPRLLGDLLAGQPADAPATDIRSSDLALLQMTGGTTGVPKAAMLSHANVLANIRQIDAWIRSPEEQNPAVICMLPFFHVFGFTVCLQLSVLKGYRMVLVPRFDPLSVLPLLKLVEQYRPVSFPAVPSVWAVMMSRDEGKRDLLERIGQPSSGGAPLPEWVQERFAARYGRRIAQAYGLSEASSTTHMTPTGGAPRHGSAGLPLPDTEARIVGLDDDERECGPDEVGELLVRGPQVMQGYWPGLEPVPTPVRDGWLHTGDLARQDADGFLYLIDRKDDLIITSGFNVYPSDVEAVLQAHPAVQDAAVVGAADQIRGQVVTALVVLKEGAAIDAQALVNHCREQLAEHQVPRTVRIVTEIPKSPVGKPLRRVLRQRDG